LKDKPIESIWKEYQQTKNLDIKKYLIEYYIDLVKLVSGRLGIYLNYYVDLEDLMSYGIIGLIDAIDKFDLTKNIQFNTYASLRIRGAILDEIRKLDWVPRSLRKKQKDFSKVYAELENQLGKTPSDEQMAKALQLPLDEYYDLLNETNIVNLISIEDYELESYNLKDTKEISPEEHMQKQELKKMLALGIDDLPDRERTVITLYYFEELTLREISNILEVSESRISQLHTKALVRLRSKLGNYQMA
jgi:RNA polymerase sigma factor for flagellar operon FliA